MRLKIITISLTAFFMYCNIISAQYKLETIAGEDCFTPGGQGILQVSLAGSSGPYDVIWPDGSQITLTTSNYWARLSNLGGGDYDVVFINKYGCEKILTGNIPTNCNRRNGDFTPTIKVYPNPFTDALFVDFESDLETSALLQITDVTGKAVYSETLQLMQGDNSYQIMPKQVLADGLYILSLQVGEQPVETFKMVKE